MCEIRVSLCWIHVIGGKINASWRGSRVFVPGPGGAVGASAHRLLSPPQMADFGG